jgi:hypothetical protein
MLGKESWERRAGTGKSVQDSRSRQSGWDRQDRKGRTGGQKMTAWTGQLEQDKRNRITLAGQP